MSEKWSTCSLCPRLCRPACPVATGTAREAAVPAVMAGVMLRWSRGQLSPVLASQAATLCTDCGACQEWCVIHEPLPRYLREARAVLLPEPVMEPLFPIEGGGRWIAVEADERPLARALATKLGEPVRCWKTRDGLGVAAVEHPGWIARAEVLREMVGDADVVVVDGGVAHALDASDIPYRWLHDLLQLDVAIGSCRVEGKEGGLACCGGAGPLPRHHPEDAARVGRAWMARGPRTPRLRDARCRNHLRSCGGGAVTDALDVLLEELGR